MKQNKNVHHDDDDVLKVYCLKHIKHKFYFKEPKQKSFKLYFPVFYFYHSKGIYIEINFHLLIIIVLDVVNPHFLQELNNQKHLRFLLAHFNEERVVM